MKTFKEIMISYPVSEESVRNLLISAMEGGSNYWMCILKYEFPPYTKREDFTQGLYAVKDEILNENLPVAYVLPFIKDGALILQDIHERQTTYSLTLEKMQNGLSVMAKKYPRYFNDLINENDDAETADVFLQCSLFGEIVYG